MGAHVVAATTTVHLKTYLKLKQAFRQVLCDYLLLQ